MTIPWQLEKLSVKDFLENIVYDAERNYTKLLFNGAAVCLDAIQFAEPTSRYAESRHMWTTEVWWTTQFSTGWTDELDDWKKWK